MAFAPLALMVVVHGAEMLLLVPPPSSTGESNSYFYLHPGQTSHQSWASQADREGLPAGVRSGVGWGKGPNSRLTLTGALIHTLTNCVGGVNWKLCLGGCQALQSVGNLGLQLGQGKEQWMEPLHPIIRLSVASVKDFLDKLIDIDHGIGKAFKHNRILNFHDA